MQLLKILVREIFKASVALDKILVASKLKFGHVPLKSNIHKHRILYDLIINITGELNNSL